MSEEKNNGINNFIPGQSYENYDSFNGTEDEGTVVLENNTAITDGFETVSDETVILNQEENNQGQWNNGPQMNMNNQGQWNNGPQMNMNNQGQWNNSPQMNMNNQGQWNNGPQMNMNNQGQWNNGPQMNMNTQPNETGKIDGFAIASLVLGILSIMCFAFCLNWLTGILAIVFGVITLVRKGNKPFAIIGIVCAAISFVLAIIVSVAFVGLMEKSSKLYNNNHNFNNYNYDNSYDYDDPFGDDDFDFNFDDNYYDEDYQDDNHHDEL